MTEELNEEGTSEETKSKVSLPAAMSVGFALVGSIGGPFAAVGCAMAGAVVGRKLEERLSATKTKKE